MNSIHTIWLCVLNHIDVPLAVRKTLRGHGHHVGGSGAQGGTGGIGDGDCDGRTLYAKPEPVSYNDFLSCR